MSEIFIKKRLWRVVFYPLFPVLIFAAPQFPDPEAIVNLTADIEETDDDGFLLTITLDILDGWHVNSDKPLDEFLIPTTLRISGLEGGSYEIDFPEPIVTKLSFSEEELSVFEGKAIIRIRLTKEQFTDGVSGSVRYQACSDEVCLMPVTKEFSAAMPGDGNDD